MSDLEELERERGNSEYMDAKAGITAASGFTDCGARTASNEMCTFLVMNISLLQLIPVNIIAYRSQYRSQYGSANPAAVSFETKAYVFKGRQYLCSVVLSSFITNIPVHI